MYFYTGQPTQCWFETFIEIYLYSLLLLAVILFAIDALPETRLVLTLWSNKVKRPVHPDLPILICNTRKTLLQDIKMWVFLWLALLTKQSNHHINWSVKLSCHFSDTVISKQCNSTSIKSICCFIAMIKLVMGVIWSSDQACAVMSWRSQWNIWSLMRAQSSILVVS